MALACTYPINLNPMRFPGSNLLLPTGSQSQFSPVTSIGSTSNRNSVELSNKHFPPFLNIPPSSSSFSPLSHSSCLLSNSPGSSSPPGSGKFTPTGMTSSPSSPIFSCLTPTLSPSSTSPSSIPFSGIVLPLSLQLDQTSPSVKDGKTHSITLTQIHLGSQSNFKRLGEDISPGKVELKRKSSSKTKPINSFQMPPSEAFNATGRLRDDAENHSLSMARSGTANQLTEYLNRINLLDLPDNIKSRAIEIYKLAAQHQKRVRKMEFHLFASIYLAHVQLDVPIFPRDLGLMVGVPPNDFMPALLHYPVQISNTSTIPQFVELTLKKVEAKFRITLSAEVKAELDKMVNDVIKVPEMARTAVDSTAIALVYYFFYTKH